MVSLDLYVQSQVLVEGERDEMLRVKSIPSLPRVCLILKLVVFDDLLFMPFAALHNSLLDVLRPEVLILGAGSFCCRSFAASAWSTSIAGSPSGSFSVSLVCDVSNSRLDRRSSR